MVLVGVVLSFFYPDMWKEQFDFLICIGLGIFVVGGEHILIAYGL